MSDRLFDLHCHPSLKIHYLPYLSRTFHAAVAQERFWNPLNFQTRYQNLKNSPVKVLVNAHYVIEPTFAGKGIKRLGRTLAKVLTGQWYERLVRADPWESLLAMMDDLEQAVQNTNLFVLGGKRLRMVRRFTDIRDLSSQEIGVVHAIEGPHALGYRDPGMDREAFWQRTRQRLGIVKDRGLAMIGLAHFMDNAFVPQIDSTEIIPKVRKGKVVWERDDAFYEMERATWSWGDRDHPSEEFVRECLRLGILLDLVHVQEDARWRIYDLCAEAGRPVVLSHNGLQHFFPHEYNLSDREVLRIREIGGVIGLILSKRWLLSPEDCHYSGGDGIADLIEVMLYIRQLTGDVACIGIGTDFDGLTHPFTDCCKPDELDRIAWRMKKHFSPREIDDVLFGNAYRVFERGWVDAREE
ncbi:MAG TPA: membrane dipeptidase [Myxococcota bacterium]|nr:membrane dipeptidase [Myxococcota bacterium]HQK49598.1 membrane dipeptidase [Myxococcota bacterium]